VNPVRRSEVFNKKKPYNDHIHCLSTHWNALVQYLVSPGNVSSYARELIHLEKWESSFSDADSLVEREPEGHRLSSLKVEIIGDRRGILSVTSAENR
jgi:hypothetical protein